MVFGPSAGVTPANVQMSLDIIQRGNCDATSFAPVFFDEFAKSIPALEVLQNLDYVYYSGVPCGRSTVKKLQSYNIRVVSGLGTTETATLPFIRERGDNDTEYDKLWPSLGCVFEHRDGDAYELVQYRDPKLEQWQVVIMVHPHLKSYPTGELWEESKIRPGYWKIVGQTDDLSVLKNASKLNAMDTELRFSSSPNVTGVMIGGKGRFTPFHLVEWKDSNEDDSDKLAKLWPEVERINESLAPHVQLERDLTLFTKREKPLLRNLKGGPVMSTNRALYKDEIEQLYASATRTVC
jgi:hypothetical protein